MAGPTLTFHWPARFLVSRARCAAIPPHLFVTLAITCRMLRTEDGDERDLQAGSAGRGGVLCVPFMSFASASEPTVAGVWQQIDPGSGFVGGLISFKEKNGLWEGYIVKMYPKPGDPVDPVCSGCTDDRKDQPVLGIRLIQNAKRDGLSYEGG